MMLGSIGDVTTTCGANPCGFTDFFVQSADCSTWQQCAAAYNTPALQPPVDTPCVAGGLDANGNTIVSCGAPACLTGPGPLQPGQSYCAGVLGQGAANPPTVGAPQWLLLGLVVFGLAMVASR